MSNLIFSRTPRTAWVKRLCVLAFALSLQPILASAETPQSIGYQVAKNVHLVTVNSKHLTALQGKALQNYSLQVISDNQLVPIPFQFDERNVQESVYVPGGGIAISGEEGIFDAEDELVFMLRDTGPALSQETKAATQANIVAELEITHGNYTGFAYVVEGSDARSTKDYANFDVEKSLFITDHWSMQASPDNLLVWTDFFYESAPANVTLLDVMKLRVIAKVFFTITLTNDNVVAKFKAAKNGPVRDIVQLKADIIVAGIPFINLDVGLEVTPHYLGIPAYAHIPLAAAAIKSPKIKVSLDFANMPGAKSRAAIGEKREAIADLKMADYEKKMSVSKEAPWLAINSQKGFDMLAFIGSSKGEGIELGGFYSDTKEANKPERFPGTGPELGYIINNLPPGDDINFRIDLIYTGGFWDNNNPEEFAKAMKDLPFVTIK